MVDAATGRPNARMEVLRLLKDNVKVGCRMVKTKFIGSDFDAEAFDGVGGRKMVVVNKRDRMLTVEVPTEFAGGNVAGNSRLEPAPRMLGSALTLPPFAVVVVTARQVE